MIDVTAIGELLIDFASKSVDAEGYPTMAANPGGAPGNFLAALSAYGFKTAFLGKVGDDDFGKRLIGTLKKHGIETKGVVTDPEVFTTLAFVTIDDTGNRSFSFARKPGADTQLRFEELDLSLIEQARVLHFGTLSLTDEPSKTATKKAVSRAKELGKWISFDPNLRVPLWNDLEEAKNQIIWGLGMADIVKISDEETTFLWGDISPEESAEKLHEMGISVVFVTLGAKGAYYSCKNGSGYAKSPKNVHPVDTTGAGDIFGGSALSRLLSANKDLYELTSDDLKNAAKFACTAAGLSTEAFGGISSVPPLEAVTDLCRSTEK